VALLEQVRTARDERRFADAVPLLLEAVGIAPQHYEIRVMLANAHLKSGAMREALAEFNEITRRFPDRSDAWNNLAGILSALGHADQALRAVERSLACDPRNAQALLNLGEITKALGDWTAARAAYEFALGVAPDDAKLHMQYGITLITLGDWARGWAEWEWRFRVPDMPLNTEDFGSPRWDGTTPLDGRTVLLAHEQGLGDAIMCARFARDLAARGARVIVRCPRPLVALLAGAPGVAEAQALHSPMPPHDLHIPSMSVPAAIGLRHEDLDGRPYLVPHGGCPARIAAALPRDGVPTVALAWAGNPLHVNDKRRSIDGARLAPLLAIPGIRFVSMQKHPATADCLPAELRDRVVDVGPLCDDFVDSAHALARCDLVVTVDSAVAHLAGAVGATTLTCLPACPDYRWLLDRTDTPWYRSMTLLRQPTLFEWGPVLATVEAVVRELASTRTPRAVA
jgi:Tfp pilus assembly protein PilF